VSGCRRYTACKTLGCKKITCVIIEANDKEAFETSLIETRIKYPFGIISKLEIVKALPELKEDCKIC
jgi:ParB-like chromosome segregation protein Spo0J